MNPIQQAISALEDMQRATQTMDLNFQSAASQKCAQTLTSLRSLNKEVEGVELPEPRAWMMEWPQHSPSFTTDKSDYVSWEFGKAHYPEALQGVYTADQLRTAVAAAMARGAVPHITPAQAMDALREAFVADPSYAWTWHCGVWAAAYDEGMETSAANRAAARLMSMAFDVDTSKHENFAATQAATHAPEATQPDPLEKLTRMSEDMKLYDDSWPDAPVSGFGPKLTPQVSGCTQPTQAEAPSEREALRRLENACDLRASLLTADAYNEAIKADGMKEALLELDRARTQARAILASQPAPEQQPTQAEAPSEREALSVIAAFPITDEKNMDAVNMRDVARRAVVRAALATQQAVQGEAVKDLVEAVDTLLDEAICECPHRMRFEDGEHFAGCYLFDLNIARTALLATPPAPLQPEALSSIDYWQRRGHLGQPAEWREACRLFRVRCSEQDIAAMAKLRAYLEEGLLEARRPEALAQQERDREDAELFRWIEKHYRIGSLRIDGQHTWMPVGMAIQRPVGPTFRDAIRAARSSEGGGNEHSR